MLQFLIKRFIGLIFVVLGVTFITFILGYLAPSDPIKEMLGQHYTYAAWARLRHEFGLDLPWYQQYFQYLGNLLHGDLGIAFHPQQRAVWDILKDGVPISVELAFWGTILTLIMGIPVGIWSALKSNTWIDTFHMGVALVLYALPPFILAVFVQIILLWVNNTLNIPWPAGALPGRMTGPIYRIKLYLSSFTRLPVMGISRVSRAQRCWKFCARIMCVPRELKGCASAL